MLSVCHVYGCRCLATNGGYCEKHQGQARPRVWKRSAQSASYHGWYQRPEWKARKAKQLAEYPVCQRCGSGDRVAVHHLVAHKGDWETFVNGPIVTLCHSCHASETGKGR